MVAKIAVAAANFAIDKPYSYWVPEGMALQPGIRVSVPFGRGNRRSEGVVLELTEESGEGLKAVEKQLDVTPLIDKTMLRLAFFMRERYFCTVYDAVRAMLPGGFRFDCEESFSLTEDRSWEEKPPRRTDVLRILELLRDLGGTATENIVQQALTPEEDLHDAVAYLLKKKWVTTQRDFKNRMHDKTERIATLASSVEEAMEYAAHRPKSAAMQRTVLETVCDLGCISVKELCYYTGAKPATVKRLEALGYLRLTEQPTLRVRQIVPAKINTNPVLNPQQEEAYHGLNAQMARERPGYALLYGVTGSGKTAVYMKLIRSCLEQGKQAVLLVPEIGLTPQLLGIVAAYFGERVAVLHSSLPATERRDQWKRIHEGKASVVVGTRSAVFAPCKNLGLIILDEEQEHSYRSENTPRYHAREVAIWRGTKEGALVLLGSATPSVETMYHARQGHYQLYKLPNRFNGKPLPKVEMVDMREQLKEGNPGSISYPLLDAIGQTAQRGKQAVLLLNRRGNSRAMVCVDCREAPECPRCSARLTYHSANNRLMCHYCGFSQPVPQRCPACDGPLKTVGVGTQKAQQELCALLPDLEVARMDADTVSAVNTHEKILEHFQKDGVSVLIGTQMVAKGLDLPNVTLVGVLDGDLGMYSGSFRAAENTFDMLTQVVGRAGRGDEAGTAMIQTLVPDHSVLNLAARQDYDGFYELEIGLRKLQQYPPFADLVSITFTGPDEGQILRCASKFRNSLQDCLKLPDYAEENCTVLGPAPCPVPKINYNFRYRLTLKCKLSAKVRGLLAHLLGQFAKDGATRGVSAFVDVNGED